ncbi:phosphomannomutase 2 [Salpingoeca rosetta]|uniref:Phosphomannomutase n=1 Tax=Salpingoeca rosetta (strain ATCC 50818 / BSB-021) TaxID=946362 RepID=F2U5K5_SALR5|nr:phosphomannomutase 2 [Salpingoeca rosetta]EGD83221.1 phosphomannomutase 2 [Salpingoeca rosetta]|eukprot:XP_004995585.1 phosphomannomutase 2 [Salpingoeca rosetta]
MSDFSDREQPDVLCLFDVDGTLTVARSVIQPEMKEFMEKLRKKCAIGLVGGSDLNKIEEQMAGTARTAYDFCFAENGLTAFKGEQELATQSFLGFLGEEKMQKLLNFCLKYIANLDIPQKRGTFIEFRNGMLNVSPIGRNCSRAERNAFEAFDKEAGVRRTFVEALKKEFDGWGLTFSIGGQISFDVFPSGWDKTYCLRHVQEHANFKTIHFFGDKAFEGGNDYEIFHHEATTGHAVKSWEDTKAQLSKLFNIDN